MIFDEIVPRTKIIITVTNGSDMEARFMTKVMRNTGEFLLVIPFRHKGKRINFKGKLIKIHMEVRDDNGVLWSFKNCRISTIKKDGLIYHKILCPMKNGIENRRGGRRFYIWEPAAIDIEGVTNTLFTNVKDVGHQGFSFVIENKKGLEVKEGTKVTASFKNNEGISMDLVGMIVRKERMEKYVIYGCKIDVPTAEFAKYVDLLERKSVVVDVDF